MTTLTAEFEFALLTTDVTRRDWRIRYRGNDVASLQDSGFHTAAAAKIIRADGSVVCQRALVGWEWLLERPLPK